nr:unnamed protein product [Callosobruchus analis]
MLVERDFVVPTYRQLATPERSLQVLIHLGRGPFMTGVYGEIPAFITLCRKTHIIHFSLEILL